MGIEKATGRFSISRSEQQVADRCRCYGVRSWGWEHVAGHVRTKI